MSLLSLLLCIVLAAILYSTCISAETEIWVSFKNDIFEANIHTASFKDMSYYTHMIQQQRLSSLKNTLGLLERPFWKGGKKAEPIFVHEKFAVLPKVSFVNVHLNSMQRYVFNSSYCTCSLTSSTTCTKLLEGVDYFSPDYTCQTYSPCKKYHCTTTGSSLCQRVQRSVPVAGTTSLGDGIVDCTYETRELAIPLN